MRLWLKGMFTLASRAHLVTPTTLREADGQVKSGRYSFWASPIHLVSRTSQSRLRVATWPNELVQVDFRARTRVAVPGGRTGVGERVRVIARGVCRHPAASGTDATHVSADRPRPTPTTRTIWAAAAEPPSRVRRAPRCGAPETVVAQRSAVPNVLPWFWFGVGGPQ